MPQSPQLYNEGLENKMFSSKKISSCDFLRTKLAARWDSCDVSKLSLDNTTNNVQGIRSALHPQPIPVSSSHQLTQRTIFLEFCSEPNSCLELVSSPPSSHLCPLFPRWHCCHYLVLPHTHTQNTKPLKPRAPPKIHASCSSLRHNTLWRLHARCQMIKNHCA